MGPVVWQDCSRETVVWHMETVASSHMIEPDGQASAVPKGCGLLAWAPKGWTVAFIADATKSDITRSRRQRRLELQGRMSS